MGPRSGRWNENSLKYENSDTKDCFQRMNVFNKNMNLNVLKHTRNERNLFFSSRTDQKAFIKIADVSDWIKPTFYVKTFHNSYWRITFQARFSWALCFPEISVRKYSLRLIYVRAFLNFLVHTSRFPVISVSVFFLSVSFSSDLSRQVRCSSFPVLFLIPAKGTSPVIIWLQ